MTGTPDDYLSSDCQLMDDEETVDGIEFTVNDTDYIMYEDKAWGWWAVHGAFTGTGYKSAAKAQQAAIDFEKGRL